MTITIQRGKSKYVYRINEFNNREIDFRANKHRGTWYRHSVYSTPEEATAALLQLEKKETKP